MSTLSNQQINNSFPSLLQVPGGITSTLKTVQDGNGNPTGLQISSTGANVTTSSTYVVTEDGTQLVGAIPRAISDGFGDCVSVKDFGAVGDGVTNNLTALANCISSANGKTIYVPVDSTGGDYAITSGTLTIPSTARFSYEAGARIYANGGTVSNSGRNFYLFGGGVGEGHEDQATRGFAVDLLGGNTGTGADGTLQYNRIRIAGDKLDASTGPGGTKVDGLLVWQDYGGTGSAGGRHAIEAILSQTGVTASTNPDRHYVGLAATSQSSTGDGGVSGTDRGGYFGGNFVASISGSAQYCQNVTGIEVNVACATGTSTAYRSGVGVVGYGDVRGSTVDAAFVVSNLSTATTTWRNAIRISASNGRHAIGTDSTVLVAQAASTIDRGFSIPQCTGNILESGNVRLADNVLQLASTSFPNHIDLGSQATANDAYLDFITSGNVVDYDARILATRGTGVAGNGTLNLYASTVQCVADTTTTQVVRPITTSIYSLGAASYLWSVVYAATGTINTSDANLKQDISSLEDAEIRVATALKGMIKKFRFKSAIAEKGDAARIHVGVIAQEVKSAFEAEGLVAERYGIFCSDTWTDDNGVEHTQMAVRYEELLAFIISAM